MPKIVVNSTAKTAFGRWVERHGFSLRDAAEALGCSVNAVSRWKKHEPPRYVLLACWAYSEGGRPVR